MASFTRLLIQRRIQTSLASLLILSGCGTMPDGMPADGPSREQVQNIDDGTRIEGIRLLSVDDALARKLSAAKGLDQFSETFPALSGNQYLIGPGDVIEVSIWEAPPAMLFGGFALDPVSGPTTTQAVSLPQQMVTPEGTITIPFAGQVPVQGRTTQQIQADITQRLKGRAHQPQILVRVLENNTSNVTLVGDVNNSTRMPLTPRGERLLDALAAGGGVNKPINKISIQLSRGQTTATMALDTIIRDPKQNIQLKPGDVITALFQSQSFSVLGATGKNEEIPFEAQGISLAQALARSGGLDDRRADARAIFIFRFEDPRLLEDAQTSTELIPVVYEVNLRDPASFFVAQHFPIQDHDVVYVANSPAAEFDKFLRMVGSVLAPTINVHRAFQ